MTHLDPTKRHDFVLLFDVAHGNPNGDPDAGNLPRLDPGTMHGLVTDVALKRKIRDYAARYRDQSIFIQSEHALNTLILRSFQAVGVQPVQVPLDDEILAEWLEQNSPEGFDVLDGTVAYGGESPREADIRAALLEHLGEDEGNKELRQKLQGLARRLAAAAKQQSIKPSQRLEARDRLCRDYFDIRLFGAVLSTGLNAGQVRGPVQLTFGQSVSPIQPLDLSITRQARTTSQRMKTGTTEIGRKSIVPYGLYRAHGFYNPFFAEQTGVTEADLGVLWDALSNMFDFDRSAARGEMATRGLYAFSHDSKLGNAAAHRLFKRVEVGLRETVSVPRQFADYEVGISDQDLPDGISLARLVD